jgi:hypothetical protein
MTLPGRSIIPGGGTTVSVTVRPQARSSLNSTTPRGKGERSPILVSTGGA